MTRNAALLLVLALALTACASGGAAGPRRNPNQISAAELAEPAVMSLTLFDAVQRLRPNWLRARGVSSLAMAGDQYPRVMINESFTDLDALRSLRATDATGLEYMSGADATTLYGTGYVNGLIKVSTTGSR